MRQKLKAPFPYFGGKSRVADLVWSRFGDTPNYIEPFFGSGAILLCRPHSPNTETVNDANAYLSNFWRALKNDPAGVAEHADWPVNECDLYAWHKWLVGPGASIVEQIRDDTDFFDAKIAGWWVWGACCWIGAGWCSGRSSWGSEFADGEKSHPRSPSLVSPNGHGLLTLSGCPSAVSATIPHLGDAGLGLHRPHQKRPHVGDDGKGVHREPLWTEGDKSGLHEYLHCLSDRFRRVRVCCGDWSRIMGPTPTFKHGLTAVFLDPPYDEAERGEVYSTETKGVAADVREWCLANGDNPLLRICLCGYAGEGHEPLEAAGWTCVSWKAAGGYGSQGDGRGRANAKRERLWFSPACLSQGLFEMETTE